MVVSNTPIEKYEVKGKAIYVKREDLSSPFPGPANAKCRGIERFLQELVEEDIRKVGVLDTRISRVGWIVAWLVKEKKYDIEVFDFYPKYKDDTGLRFAQKMAKYFGARLVPQPAGRDWYRYALARRHMKEIGGIMLPDKLRFIGATLAVAEEVQQVEEELLRGTIVVSVGSGTILSGVIKGLADRGIVPNLVVGPLCASEATIKSRKRYIAKLLESDWKAKVLFKHRTLLVPSRWSYFEPLRFVKTPFPCDPYYDRKAWIWLLKNLNRLPEPILFWNIGGEWDLYYGLAKGMRGDGRVTKEEFEKVWKEVEKVVISETT